MAEGGTSAHAHACRGSGRWGRTLAGALGLGLLVGIGCAPTAAPTASDGASLPDSPRMLNVDHVLSDHLLGAVTDGASVPVGSLLSDGNPPGTFTDVLFEVDTPRGTVPLGAGPHAWAFELDKPGTYVFRARRGDRVETLTVVARE